MFNQVQQILEGAALMQGATYHIRKQGEAIGIENSPALIEEIVPLAQGNSLDTIHTRRFGASEDAGFLIERVQQHGGEAAYLILGANLAAPHHHPEFDFDEAVLAPGVALLEAWLLARLGR
jgi:aminobenzoyl-glutamate utilization protein A